MSKVLVIAEAGVNHNGDFNIAKKLVDAAKEAGADIVKFQTFKADTIVTRNAEMADYQKQNTKKVESQYEMLKRLELSFDQFVELKEYCDKIGIQFLSTGFDLESLKFLNTLKPSMWKIPSGELTNLPYIEYIGSLNSRVVVSTGMSTLKEVEDCLAVLISSGTQKSNITVLHCTTEYPAPVLSVNLNAMITMKNKFGVEIGYSDHTNGIEISIAATALGAKVIEKHFTLDKNMQGPDHKASLEPNELKKLVDSVRNVALSLGDGKKDPSLVEIKNIEIVRKSIVAKREIANGEIFSLDNLDIKRPGIGISPMKFKEIIGKKAKRNFKKDELIEL